MKHFIEKKPDSDRPKKRARSSWTAEFNPLHKVASEGSVKRLKRILKDDRELLEQTLLNSKAEDGRTPLHHAVLSGSLNTVGTLVSFGARLDVIDNMGCPPIAYASTAEMEDYLLALGAQKFDHVYSEMHLAILDKNIDEIKRLIKQNPGLLDIGEFAGNTPLHLAVMQEELEIVKMLVLQGANIDALNNEEFSPIVYANKEIKRFLLTSGARDPYHTPLHDAAFDGNIRKMKRLLQRDESQLNAQDILSTTPLHFAVLSGRLDAVKMLVEQGAGVNGYDDDSMLPIHYSSESPEISEYLIQHGSIDAKFTELHDAASQGDIVKLEAILNQNPESIEALDSRGLSPLCYAAALQQHGAFRFLLQRGAKIDRVINDGTCSNLIDLAKKEDCHTPLSKYIQNRIRLSRRYLDEVSYELETLLKKELKMARSRNKKLLILLGETHNTYKINQIEKIIFKIAKDLGITTVLGEYNDANEEAICILKTAETLGMEIIGVDNHKDRDKDPFSEKGMRNRNIIMARDAARINQDAVMIVGSSHLEGLLEEESSQIDLDQFHVVPMNLSSLVPIIVDEEDTFAYDASYILQFSGPGYEHKGIRLLSESEESEKEIETTFIDAEEGTEVPSKKNEDQQEDAMEYDTSEKPKRGWCIVS
ncbi:MAG: hypothetical protein BGO43_10530 [Gammaproteobacteria bacterium 39-13]|nr:ankyrin repeat domain-containing protein [Gammaproteobacteria bacterium]OJV88283.1 MAG: hypothetical protein BGO43_10530 [Gammaproteobacteria bacterium 39-13]